MTTRVLSNRDAKARSAIEAVINTELAGLPPKRIVVTPRENYSGEPALYVLVVVSSEQDIPAEPDQNRLVVRMVDALEQIEDSRFPYLYFGFDYLDDGSWVELSPADEKA
jgi:hypothetical protein